MGPRTRSALGFAAVLAGSFATTIAIRTWISLAAAEDEAVRCFAPEEVAAWIERLPELRGSSEWTAEGARVVEVPAVFGERFGIEVGDVITAVNGARLVAYGARAVLAAHGESEDLVFEVRRGGQVRSLRYHVGACTGFRE